MRPKYRPGDLVRLADLKKTFSKTDSINWSYKLSKITEIVKDTIPNYHIRVAGKANSSQSEQLWERYNEGLLNKTELSMEANKKNSEKLGIPMES